MLHVVDEEVDGRVEDGEEVGHVGHKVDPRGPRYFFLVRGEIKCQKLGKVGKEKMTEAFLGKDDRSIFFIIDMILAH